MARAVTAGDPNRYGGGWWSIRSPTILSLLAAGTLGYAHGARDTFGWYLVAQLVIPLALIFGVGVGLGGWHIPLYQSRQFMVLLPAYLLAATIGLCWYTQQLPQPVGYSVTGALGAAIALVSAVALGEYWEALNRVPRGPGRQGDRPAHSAGRGRGQPAVLAGRRSQLLPAAGNNRVQCAAGQWRRLQLRSKSADPTRTISAPPLQRGQIAPVPHSGCSATPATMLPFRQRCCAAVTRNRRSAGSRSRPSML